MSHWMMYGLLKLDDLVSFFVVLTIIAGGVSFIGLVFGYLMRHSMDGMSFGLDEEAEAAAATRMIKRGRVAGVCALGTLLIVMLVPTTKQAAAVWLVPKVMNNEAIQGDAQELYGLALEALEKQLGGLEKEAPPEVLWEIDNLRSWGDELRDEGAK